jgi:small subunit ribosomal protein S6
MYELTFLVNPNISEEDLADVIKQLRDSITRAEGKITKDFFSKRINLAYPVKKLRQAFFITVEFEINRDKLDSVKTQVDSIKSIIRHLIITKLPLKITAKKIKPLKTKTRTKVKEKIKIEELDKKLEEILEA